MNTKILITLLAFGFCSVAASEARAAGFEKSIMWGGRSSGFAGISTPYMTGADALYFNPGGIVTDKPGQEVSINVSPVWSQFKGPINNQNVQATSSTNFSTPFGLIYGNTVNEKWGFAVGGYASAGSKVAYDHIDFPGVSPGMDLKTDVQILELAAGAAYRVDENLKIGASLRSTYSTGEFAVIQRLGTLPAVGYSVANIKVTDIKDSKPGFALGAEYKLDEKWQFGLRYRSPIRIEGSSTIGGDVHTASGATIGIKSADATVVTEFPQALTIGALHKCDDIWTILAEYAWTNYSKVDVIDVNGPIVTSSGTALASKSAVPMYWQDQHNYRLAAQYGHEGEWPLRFGYGYTSQVTNTDYARAAFTAPAAANTVAIGTGRDFTWSERAMRFDSGLEYTWSSGSGNPNGAAAGSNAGDFRQGDFALSSYALHLGLASTF